jgi:hypothetical protein
MPVIERDAGDGQRSVSGRLRLRHLQEDLIGKRSDRLQLIGPERDVDAEHRRRRLAGSCDAEEFSRRDPRGRKVDLGAGT